MADDTTTAPTTTDPNVDPVTGQPLGFMDRLGRAFSSPLVQGLMGMSGGFAQAAMPTRMPIPFGAAFGMGMGGLGQGISNAYKTQLEAAQAQQATLGNQLATAQMPAKLAQAKFQNQALQELLKNPDLLKQMIEQANGGGTTSMAPQLPGQGAVRSALPPGMTTAPTDSGVGATPGALPPPPKLAAVTAPSTGAKLSVAEPYQDRFQGLVTDLDAAGFKIDPATSGGYNPRMIAGTNTPSEHAFGRAIDINWKDNPQGGTQSTIPPDLAHQLATKYGMTWGGDWTGKSYDPMHFEIAKPQGQGGTYQVAQADGGVQPPPGQGASTAGSGGGYGGLTPAWAMQQYQQLNARARIGELSGMAIYGDPATLRQQAGIYLKYALAPSQAAAEEIARLGPRLQYAGPIKTAETTAEQSALLPFVGPKAAAESQAQLPAKLAEAGFMLTPTGMAPIPGGKADLKYVGAAKAAEEAAKINVDRQGNIYQGGNFIGRGPQMVQAWDPKIGGMTWTFTPGVGVGASVGEPGGGGGNTGIPSAVPVQTKETLESAGKAPGQRQTTDEKFVNEDLSHTIDTVIPSKAALFQLKGLNPDVDTGALGAEKNAFKNFVQTWLPGFADKVGDAAPAQEFQKIVTMLAGQQERGDQGARGGIALLKAYANANPSLTNQPTANKDMVNALLIYHQLREDYANGATNFYNNSYDKFVDPNGPHTYAPLSRYDQAYIRTMRPELYASAIAALNGKPSDVWAKGLNDKQAQIVAGIIQRADPSAMIDLHGKSVPASSFTKTFGPTDIVVGGVGG